MQLPFSREQFLAVFAWYNVKVWPMQLVLVALALMIVFFAWRRSVRPGFHAGALAALWLWMGVVYHIRFFAFVNPAAYLFGALFVVQAALFVWFGVFRDGLRIGRPASRVATWAGGAAVAYALLLYPLVGILAGHDYPALPTFGLPCPTTIFTLGVFAWATKPVPWPLLVIPIAWTLVGTSAATSLGMVEDYALIPAALAYLAIRFQRPKLVNQLG